MTGEELKQLLKKNDLIFMFDHNMITLYDTKNI